METTRHQTLDTPPGRFGTFGGVFTPSILTILGVIMYLRFGWITGSAGLGQTMLIVLVAHLITLSTGLSVSSIATNRRVGAGGAYFIISRSLGAPAGAAIGIPLFLSQSLSIAFYVVGFTESLLPALPEPFASWSPTLISSVMCAVLFVLTFVSADLAIKTQYVVMGAIALSLVSFFGGRGDAPPESITWWNGEGPGFGPIFAVFFPAVTGIMAGVGMSGDLKDPRRSLPRGTLMAIAVGFVVYMIFPVWLALNATPEAMLDGEVNVVFAISWIPALIFLGVWGATLSSALGSFLTAPRTLQALASDHLAPRIFARGYGKTNEPRMGIAFTFLLAECGILLGSLDSIANVLTMFFLATYGFTNLAAGLEQWAKSPSFRPEFKTPAIVSLLGAAACFYVMSILGLGAMLAAASVGALIWVFVARRSLTTTYGDARHGIWSAIAQAALTRLDRTDFHPENWRPNLIIVGGAPPPDAPPESSDAQVQKRKHLLELGSAIVQDRGIVTFAALLPGSVRARAPYRQQWQRSFERSIAGKYQNVFVRVDIVDNIYRGAVTTVQGYGVGNLEANTVMLGWPTQDDEPIPYAEMLLDLARLDRSLLLCRTAGAPPRAPVRGDAPKRIQIWWGGLAQNGGMMLLITYLLRQHRLYRRATVEVITIVDGAQHTARAQAAIVEILAQARLEARPRVLVRNGRAIGDIMAEQSAATDLSILGLRLPEEPSQAPAFFERMNRLLDGLPTTLLVHSANNFEGERILFDPATSQTSADPPPAPTPAAPEPDEPRDERTPGDPPVAPTAPVAPTGDGPPPS